MPLSNGSNLGLLVNGVEGEEHYTDLMKQWRGLDALVQPVVQDKDQIAPPTDIVDGQVYIIPSGATGVWAGRTNMLARGFTVGDGAPGWQYFVPKKGWSVMVLDEGDQDGTPLEYRFTGTVWKKPDLGPTREEVLTNPMTNLGDIIFGDSEANAARLPIGADRQVLTAVDGVPVWRDPPVGGGPGEGGGMANPMLAAQDLIVGGLEGAPNRLPKGPEGYSLQIIGGVLAYGPQAGGGGGGMTNPMIAAGDIIYGGLDGVPTRLVKGTDGQVLKLLGGLPAWGEDLVGTGGGGGMVNPMTAARDMIIGGTAGAPVRVANGSAGQLWSSSGWVTLPTYVLASTLGVTVATLDGSGKVPAAQLPSYVDDVLEFNTLAAFPFPGEAGKIYVALNTSRQYRFPEGGTDYVELVASPGTTDNVPEGTTNKYWTAARTLATALAGLVTSTATAVVATDTILVAIGKLQAQFGAVLLKAGGAMTGAIGGAPPATGTVSGGTLDMSATNSNIILVGGGDPISYAGYGRAGDERTVVATAAQQFYDGASLILPGRVNATLAEGDSMNFVCSATGVWICTNINRRGVTNAAARVLTAVNNSTVTLASLTALTIPLDANSTYEFHAEVVFSTAAATTGANIGWLAPSGADALGRITVPITVAQGTSALSKSGQAGQLNVSGTATSAGLNHCASLSGMVTTTTAGNFAIQFASSVAGSMTTVGYGSMLTLRKIG